MTIQIWYPAQPRDEERATYAPEIDDYDEWTQENWGLAASRLTRSFTNAPISDAQDRYPLILYSPGYGNPAFSGTVQTELLASHGYVVVGIGHSGLDSRVRYPDGYVYGNAEEITAEAPEPESQSTPEEELIPIERYRMAGQADWLQSAYSTGLQDIRFVIDRLEVINGSSDSRFYRRLDVSSIGGLGFSIGGSNYLQATLEEPRIAAAANMDGGLAGLSILTRGARKPILLVQQSEGYPKVSNGPTDAGLEEFFVEVERQTWQMLRLSTDEWYKATILGTEHPHFSDAYLIVPAPDGMIDPRRAHHLMNRLTLEFFDRHLRDSEDTPLLSHDEIVEDLRLVTRQAE